VRGLVAIVLVAGCYSPTVPEGVACGPGRACPEGQSCGIDDRCRSTPVDGSTTDVPIDVLPPADSSIDGSPVADTDGDTIKDNVDNCPMLANMDQRDHDADGVGDVCDNCPHIANGNQAHGLDADAVGDACDPNNARLDTQVFFEGFYATPVGWNLPTGWTVAGGKLTGVFGGSSIAYKDTAMPANITVVTHGTMSMAGGLAPNVSVVAHSDTTASDFYRCGVVDTRVEITKYVGASQTTIDQVNLTPDLTDITVTFDITAGTFACVTKAGATTMLSGSDAVPLTGDRAGVRVRGSTGTFDYVIVYSH